MDTVKVGIIGAGGIAQAHMQALTATPGVEIVAIADVNPEAAKNSAARWSIANVHDSADSLCERDDVQGVFVCTPTGVHAAPTLTALNAGKHVFVEKPMDASLANAAEMVRTAKQAGKILMCGLKLRFATGVKIARDIIASGDLGDIYYAESTADRRRATPGPSFTRKDLAGFGATADLGIYALDTALYLMGHPTPVAVNAITQDVISKTAQPVAGQWFGKPEVMEVEEFAAAWVRFSNGTVLLMRTSWAIHMDSLGGSYFLGSKGGLRIGAGEVRPGHGYEDGIRIYRDEHGAMSDSTLQNVGAVDMMDLFRKEDAAFLEAVRTDSPSPIDPHGVLIAQTVIQGIVDSAAAGREVAVEVPSV